MTPLIFTTAWLLTPAVALSAADWHDRFYQYRIPLTLDADTAGRHTAALTPADIVTAINATEQLKFDPAWFAYNFVKIVEVDELGQVIGPDVDAGFTLVLEKRQLIPPGALDGTKEKLDVAVEPGATYLLRYTNEGGGRSPALSFEPIFPVLHKLTRQAYHISHEPRLLPRARITREVLIVPNTATLPLRVKDRFVTGVQDVSLRKGRIVFDVHFEEAGRKHLRLYYQPLTGHFLTIPKRRRDTVPPRQATLAQMDRAEKYEGQTHYRLPGSNAVSLWFAETTVKLTPESPAPVQNRDAIRISSAAHEAQSFQLVLQPRRDLDFQALRSSALVGPSGRIEPEAIEVRRIDYVPITEPSFISPVSYRGRIADPLVAARPGTLSPLDGNVGFWLTVRTPAGAAAGTYRGHLTLDLGDDQIRLPLELEVFGFQLPEFSPFRSSMGGAHITKVITDEKTVADYHGVTSKAHVKKLARAYYDEMARHKFTPHSVIQYTDIGMNWTPPPAGFNVDKPGNHFALHDWDFTELNHDLAHYIDELKVNAFTLVHTNPSVITRFKHLPGADLTEYNRTPSHFSLGWQAFREATYVGYDKREQDDYIEITKAQFDRLVLDFYRVIAENLEEHGWLDYAYILVDESAYRGYEPYLDFSRLLKSDPLTARIQHAWCLQGPAAFNYKSDPADADYAFNHLLDIYMPETNENHHFWEKYYFTDYDVTPTRERLWNYVTYTTRVAIDTPGINNRAIALEVFNNGGGGFLIWGTFIWDSKRHHESNHDNPWEQPWTRWGNGAMAYFYPPHKAGPVAQPDFTIVPSLRIQTYRESVDDFEYAWMLEQRIAAARLRGQDVAAQQAVLDDIERFFVGPVHWSQNDAWYLELRKRLARAIEQLNS